MINKKRLKRAGRIVRRELSSIRSEKTILLAILVQLIIASFSSFLIVGLVPMYSPSSTSSNVQVTVGVSGQVDEATQAINEVDGANARIYDSYQNAFSAYQEGEVNAVIQVTESENGGLTASVIVPRSGIESTVIVSKMKAVLQTMEEQQREDLSHRLEKTPLEEIQHDSSGSTYFSFIYTVLIPLLVFLPAFISGSLASDTITEGIKEGTMELLQSAPVTDGDIVNAKMAAMTILAPFQVILWMSLLALNDITVSNIIGLSGLTLGFTMIVVSMGTFIALVYRDRRSAQFAYSGLIVLVSSVFLVLPEHPANTVAKISIGSATTTTWSLVAFYMLLGLGCYSALVYYAEKYGVQSD